jgi:hypothetical protein
MEKPNIALTVAAGASLLQACGGGGSSSDATTPMSPNGSMSNKARQMLYLPNNMDFGNLETAIQQPAENFNDLPYETERHYVSEDQPEHSLLFYLLFNARSEERPLSKDYFDLWVTYQLANSFVFAMGEELSTVSSARINTHLNNIRTAVETNQSIPEIMLEYFLDDIFWARFRSPEDNGREVFEIYLGDYRDEIVPPLAKILQNYSFNENQGTLEIDSFNRNTQPQDIDGTLITSPNELYQYVVEHDNFMPHIYQHIVKALYGYEDEDAIAQMNRNKLLTFREIYQEALTNTALQSVNRAKYPEEVLFPAVKTLNVFLQRNDIKVLNDIMTQIGSQPLFSKLERRPPDWNSLNTSLLAELMDSRIANEMRNLGNNWSYGVAQWQFYEFFNYLDNTSGLLTDLHAKIWGEENIQYDTVFTDYLDNSEATDSDLIILALQIVVMNYQYYNFS